MEVQRRGWRSAGFGADEGQGGGGGVGCFDGGGWEIGGIASGGAGDVDAGDGVDA